MAASKGLLLLTAFWTTCVYGASGEEYCYVNNTKQLCKWGCCDEFPNQECCDWAIKFIQVFIWGGLLAIAILVSLVLSIIILCKKRPVVHGRVIHPPGTNPGPLFDPAGNHGYTYSQTGTVYSGPGVQPYQSTSHLPPITSTSSSNEKRAGCLQKNPA